MFSGIAIGRGEWKGYLSPGSHGKPCLSVSKLVCNPASLYLIMWTVVQWTLTRPQWSQCQWGSCVPQCLGLLCLLQFRYEVPWPPDLKWQGRTVRQQLGKYCPWSFWCRCQPLVVAGLSWNIWSVLWAVKGSVCCQLHCSPPLGVAPGQNLWWWEEFHLAKRIQEGYYGISWQ